MKGRGYVHWTNQQLRGAGTPRFRDTRHHAGSEEYLNRTLVLTGTSAYIKLNTLDYSLKVKQ